MDSTLCASYLVVEPRARILANPFTNGYKLQMHDPYLNSGQIIHRSRLVVDAHSQLFTHFEEGDTFGRNRHDFTRLGVAPIPRPPMLDHEAAEAANLDSLFPLQRVDQRIEDGVDNNNLTCQVCAANIANCVKCKNLT